MDATFSNSSDLEMLSYLTAENDSTEDIQIDKLCNLLSSQPNSAQTDKNSLCAKNNDNSDYTSDITKKHCCTCEHHTGEISELELCDATFSREASTTKKKLTPTVHLEEKKFICVFCNKIFSEKRCLIKHIFIHIGEKTYTCETCQAIFASRSRLNTHKKSVACCQKYLKKMGKVGENIANSSENQKNSVSEKSLEEMMANTEKTLLPDSFSEVSDRASSQPPLSCIPGDSCTGIPQIQCTEIPDTDNDSKTLISPYSPEMSTSNSKSIKNPDLFCNSNSIPKIVNNSIQKTVNNAQDLQHILPTKDANVEGRNVAILEVFSTSKLPKKHKSKTSQDSGIIFSKDPQITAKTFPGMSERNPMFMPLSKETTADLQSASKIKESQITTRKFPSYYDKHVQLDGECFKNEKIISPKTSKLLQNKLHAVRIDPWSQIPQSSTKRLTSPEMTRPRPEPCLSQFSNNPLLKQSILRKLYKSCSSKSEFGGCQTYGNINVSGKDNSKQTFSSRKDNTAMVHGPHLELTSSPLKCIPKSATSSQKDGSLCNVPQSTNVSIKEVCTPSVSNMSIKQEPQSSVANVFFKQKSKSSASDVSFKQQSQSSVSNDLQNSLTHGKGTKDNLKNSLTERSRLTNDLKNCSMNVKSLTNVKIKEEAKESHLNCQTESDIVTSVKIKQEPVAVGPHDSTNLDARDQERDLKQRNQGNCLDADQIISGCPGFSQRFPIDTVRITSDSGVEEDIHIYQNIFDDDYVSESVENEFLAEIVNKSSKPVHQLPGNQSAETIDKNQVLQEAAISDRLHPAHFPTPISSQVKRHVDKKFVRRSWESSLELIPSSDVINNFCNEKPVHSSDLKASSDLVSNEPMLSSLNLKNSQENNNQPIPVTSTSKNLCVSNIGNQANYCHICCQRFDPINEVPGKECMFRREDKMILFTMCGRCDSTMVQLKYLTVDLEALDPTYVEYKCNICLKRFRKKSQLWTHVNKHGVENKKLCGFCGKICPSKNEQMAHMLTHVDKMAVIKCRKCNIHFASIEFFFNHECVQIIRKNETRDHSNLHTFAEVSEGINQYQSEGIKLENVSNTGPCDHEAECILTTKRDPSKMYSIDGLGNSTSTKKSKLIISTDNPEISNPIKNMAKPKNVITTKIPKPELDAEHSGSDEYSTNTDDDPPQSKRFKCEDLTVDTQSRQISDISSTCVNNNPPSSKQLKVEISTSKQMSHKRNCNLKQRKKSPKSRRITNFINSQCEDITPNAYPLVTLEDGVVEQSSIVIQRHKFKDTNFQYPIPLVPSLPESGQSQNLKNIQKLISFPGQSNVKGHFSAHKVVESLVDINSKKTKRMLEFDT